MVLERLLVEGQEDRRMTAVRGLDEADLGAAFGDRVRVGGGRCAVLGEDPLLPKRPRSTSARRLAQGGRVEARRQQRAFDMPCVRIAGPRFGRGRADQFGPVDVSADIEPRSGEDGRGRAVGVVRAWRRRGVDLLDEDEPAELACSRPSKYPSWYRYRVTKLGAGDVVPGRHPFDHMDREGQPSGPRPAGGFVVEVEPGRRDVDELHLPALMVLRSGTAGWASRPRRSFR